MWQFFWCDRNVASQLLLHPIHAAHIIQTQA